MHLVNLQLAVDYTGNTMAHEQW